MDKSMIFNIWLQECLGYTGFDLDAVLEKFGSAEQIFLSREADFHHAGCFTSGQIGKLYQKNLDKAKHIYEQSRLLGYQLTAFDDEEYPDKLRTLSFRPIVLYTKGKLPPSDMPAVALVGTRRASVSGERAAFDLGYHLARSGVAVVSGGAMGIDKSAHKGALQANGTTICVMGCGINADYLRSLRKMREMIAQTGALVSEYPPDYEPARYTFPKRNRIISALSDGVVVVEAGTGSGSLITAKYAVEQHKRLFAVKANTAHTVSSGTEELLAGGAMAVSTYMDVLNVMQNRQMQGGREGMSITPEIIDDLRKNSPEKHQKKSVSAPKRGRRKTEREITAPEKHTARASAPAVAEKRQMKPLSAPTSPAAAENADIGGKISDEFLKKELTEQAYAVYHTLTGASMMADELKLRLHIDINELLNALAELVVEGYVEELPGGVYRAVL